MGWMYYTLLKQDVFVVKILETRMRDENIYFALYFSKESQRWEVSGLDNFLPPKEKHN